MKNSGIKPETLGAQLREARIAKEMSVEQVSRVLSIRPSLVTALESGNYREVGAILYAKNYLRKYAKLLNIPLDEFEQSLEQLQESTDPRSQGFYEPSKVKHEAEEKKRSNNFKYYLLFVVVLIAVFAYLYKTGVIPSPFKDRPSFDTNGVVNLPNERLPSLELEYNLQEGGVMNEDVTFEEILSDSLREQQAALVNEYHEEEALGSALNEQSVYEEEKSHFVMLNKESEVLGENFSNIAAQDNEKKKHSGRFDVLGAALRNYSPLLSATSLPLIDLGTKSISGRFTPVSSHIQYFYGLPNKVRLGVDVPQSFVDDQTHRFNELISIYDRESGFYPFLLEIVDRSQLKAQQRRLELLQNILIQKNSEIVALTETIDLPLQEQRKIPLLEEEIATLEERYEKLQESIKTGEEKLLQKDLVQISTVDITTVDVQDAKGRTLVNRVMRSGDQYQLDANGIYDIYLGNPAVIEKITVNGKAIPEYYYKPLTEEAVSIRFSLNSELYR